MLEAGQVGPERVGVAVVELREAGEHVATGAAQPLREDPGRGIVGLVAQVFGEFGGALLLAVEPLPVFGDDRRQPGRELVAARPGERRHVEQRRVDLFGGGL